MNIREAILRAADMIELHPKQFDFMSIYVPSCGTPGCAIGWIGCFMGIRDTNRSDGKTNVGYVCAEAGLPDSMEFYNRMDLIAPRGWRRKAVLCAQGLRAYADKYHPADGCEEIRGIPDAVRNIFTMTPGELAEALDAA